MNRNRYFIIIMFFMLILVYISAETVVAGPITGNYWFLGIGNDQAHGENDSFFDALSQYSPWKQTPNERVHLCDNIGGTEILKELKFFHDKVKDGDTFIFYYGGHATNMIPDNNTDDPGHDEGIGKIGDIVSDDHLASDPYFGSFPNSSTVIAIFNTCFAGGFIGGSSDLDRTAITQKHNLLFMGSQAEDTPCGLEGPKFVPLLMAALEQGDSDGDKQVHAKEWLSKMKEFWNREDNGRRLIVLDNLDDEHNRTIAKIPEPSTFLLIVSVLIGLFGIERKKLLKM